MREADRCRDGRWPFAVRLVRRWDWCDGANGWLGLAGHELGERENEQREREREQRRGRCGWGWLGTVRKRADSEKERKQRLNEE